jgi:ubiquinone/menaquinone biosynthesis C-methylase UbiE
LTEDDTISADIARLTLVSLLRGYRAPQILFLAHDLGLFEHLSVGPQPADALGRRTGIAPDRLRHLLGALTGMEILELRRDGYALAEPFVDLLTPRTAQFIGPIIDSARGENAYWSRSARNVLANEGEADAYFGEFLDGPTVHQNLRNVEASNRETIEAVWPWIADELADARSILDLGGGHGLYAQGALERVPSARARILDIPEAIRFCRQRLAGSSCFDRIDFASGDALRLNEKERYDLVFVNDLLVYFDAARKREILRRVYAAAQPGGLLVMVKIALDADGASPRFGSLFSLNMFVTTQCGYLESDDEAAALCAESGFRAVRIHRLTGDRSLITARR